MVAQDFERGFVQIEMVVDIPNHLLVFAISIRNDKRKQQNVPC
jgi:hypothetical protein